MYLCVHLIHCKTQNWCVASLQVTGAGKAQLKTVTSFNLESYCLSGPRNETQNHTKNWHAWSQALAAVYKW
jgi:hypothetical protein